MKQQLYSTAGLMSFIERKADAEKESIELRDRFAKNRRSLWVFKWRLLGLCACAVAKTLFAHMMIQARNVLEGVGASPTVIKVSVLGGAILLLLAVQYQISRYVSAPHPNFQFLYFFMYTIPLGYLATAVYGVIMTMAG
jgi:hypothetical protein